jgi:hypothetical protein
MRRYGEADISVRNDALSLQNVFWGLRQMRARVLPRVSGAVQVRRGGVETSMGSIR